MVREPHLYELRTGFKGLLDGNGGEERVSEEENGLHLTKLSESNNDNRGGERPSGAENALTFGEGWNRISSREKTVLSSAFRCFPVLSGSYIAALELGEVVDITV